MKNVSDGTEDFIEDMDRASNIDILRMVYFDMFFLFLGVKTFNNNSQVEYLYLTKNMEIQKEFMIHN